MSFTWAKNYPDLLNKCKTFALYHLEDPLQHFYKPLIGLMQEGPQCGLVALAMCTAKPNKESVQRIFEIAKENQYTNNGEIFSVDYMCELSQIVLNNKIEIHDDYLNDVKIVTHLLNDGLVLVPYDCDKNHSPCDLNGHKAHWAVLCGVVVTDEGVYVVAKHGKSLNLAIWELDELSRSNAQLLEFSPDRKQSDLIYVLPVGSLQGPNGLCKRSVLIHPLDA